MLKGKSSWTVGSLGAAALALLLAVGLAWMLWPAGSAQAQEAVGYEPADVRVVPGDRTLTVSWKTTPRPGVSDDQIRHALRWSQQSGVWANPKGNNAVGRNDGVSVEPGVTSYVITGLENGTATGVFVRSFTGPNYYERAKGSSKWVRTKGDHTTPREEQQANNAPTVASAIADATIVNESGTKVVSLTGVFADADGDSLTVTATSSDEGKATASVAADQSSLTVSAKSRGAATITTTASDGNGGTVQDAFTVTVKAAPALALPLSHIPELEAGAARDVSLSGIFSDADGDALTITAASSDDTTATVSVASDQSKLTVTGVAQGTATITVTAQDTDGNQASGAFDVAVVPAPQQQKQQAKSSDATLRGIAVYVATDHNPDNADNVLHDVTKALTVKPAVSAGVREYGAEMPEGDGYYVARANDGYYVAVSATPTAAAVQSIVIRGPESPLERRDPRDEVMSGEASGPWFIDIGYSLITIAVTAEDGANTEHYRLVIKRGEVDEPKGLRLAPGDGTLTLRWDANGGPAAPTHYTLRWRKAGETAWLNHATDGWRRYKTSYAADAPHATAADGTGLYPAASGSVELSGLDNGVAYEVQARGVRFHTFDPEVMNWLKSDWRSATGTPERPATELGTQVSAGANHACVLRNGGTEDSEIVCWGSNQYGESTPPSGAFKQLSAGFDFTCAIRSGGATDGQIECWGRKNVRGVDNASTTPPAGTFAQIDAGTRYACGVRTDGQVVCWGDSASRPIPPATFKKVATWYMTTCGVKTDGGAACWGRNDFGQANAPTGTFQQVDAGAFHSCGLKTDGQVVCWGIVSSGRGRVEDQGQTTPPAGIFAQISSAVGHNCGVRTDGRLACWGFNNYGQSTPPAGTFTQVSSGSWFSCGVRTDDQVLCWGRDDHGETRPPSADSILLTITPANPTREYGEADDLGYAVNGLIDGDAAADVVTGALSRAAGNDAGGYAIGLGTLAIASDYARKYALPSGPAVTTYTITPKAITAIGGVTVNARASDGTTTATFDTSAAAGTGVLPAELADFRAGGLQVRGSFPAATPGTHDLSVTYALRDHGAFRAANYSLSAATDTLQGELTAVPVCGSGLMLFADGVPSAGGDPVTVIVALSSPAAMGGGAKVSLTLTGTAVVGDDYTLSATTVTIPAGATAGTATLTVFDVDDDGATIILNGALVGTNLTAEPLTFFIEGNDHAATPVVPHISNDSGDYVDLVATYDLTGAGYDDAALRRISLPQDVTMEPALRAGHYSYQLTVPHAMDSLTFAGIFNPLMKRDPKESFAILMVGNTAIYEEASDTYTGGNFNSDAYELAQRLLVANSNRRSGTNTIALPMDATTVIEVAIYKSRPGLWWDLSTKKPPNWADRKVVYTLAVTRGDPPAAAGDADAVVPTAFKQVESGYSWTCGVRNDGQVACWGYNRFGQATPPAGTFTQVSAGGYHTCGLKTDGQIACWGANSNGQATPPAGTFKQVSAGATHTCGLKTGPNGEVVCWGSDYYGLTTPPAGPFTQISSGSGGAHTCGLRPNGEVACWGQREHMNGLSELPGRYKYIGAGIYHTCGVQTDGQLACWEYSPKAGKIVTERPQTDDFSQVVGGEYFACGLKTDGAVVCWASNGKGKATPPAGTFTQISAGGHHVCGLKTDGEVVCWGSNEWGRAVPPQQGDAGFLYRVNFDADLDDLTISAGSLSFSRFTRDYYVNVPHTVDSVVLTPVTSAPNATVTVDGEDPATPVKLDYGETSITVITTAADGETTTVYYAWVTRTQPANQAPVVASPISDVSGLAVGDTQDVSLSGVFSDADGDSLTITAASSDTDKVTVSVASDGSRLTLTGVAEGAATVTVTAQDTDGNSVSDAFDVSVVAASAQQQAPSTNSFTIRVDTAFGNLVGWVQARGEGALVSGDAAFGGRAVNGLIRMDAGRVRLSMETGTASSEFPTRIEISDGAGWTATFDSPSGFTARGLGMQADYSGDASGLTAGRQVTVALGEPATAPANSAPTVASAIADATVVNESGTQSVSLSGVFDDADNDALTITAASSNTAKATVSVAADQSTLKVTAKSRGTATITVTASDGNGGTVEDAFIVTVKAAPTVASAIADVSGLTAGDTRDVSLSGVFSDADGDALTITAASSSTDKVTAAVASDGSKLTLTGVAGGNATVTVTAQDSDGNQASDAFQVSVAQAQQQAKPEGPEPWDIRIVPGDGILTVTWKVGSHDVDDAEVRHALRWSQESGVWANPRCVLGTGANDGLCLDAGVTSYTITGLKNGVPTGVFVRSFTGDSASERSPDSSKWVRIKGDNTTPKAAQ